MPVTQQLVQNLRKLPVELALPIIDDLRVSDVIKLMLQDDPRVDRFLLAHAGCRAILGSDAEALQNGRLQVKAYLDFAEQWNLDLQLYKAYKSSPLCDAIWQNKWKPSREWPFVETCHIFTWQVLQKLPSHLNDILRPYMTEPKELPKITIHSSLNEYKQYWGVMAEAKGLLSRDCSTQLFQIARLLEGNPDILKRATDPSQVPRPNIQHIISRMKLAARRLEKSGTQDFHGNANFGYWFFPIVPFDRALQNLFQMMKQYRMISENLVLASEQHPPAVMEMANIVLSDLRVFYFAPFVTSGIIGVKSQIDKIRWSSLLRTSDAEEQLNAAERQKKIAASLNQWQRTAVRDRHMPHKPELERWLIAFVNLYRYLESLGTAEGKRF